MGDRCTGQCCKRFPIHMSIAGVRDQAARTAATHPDFAVEMAMIADLVIWEGSRNDGTAERPVYVELYTCKHRQANGDCGAYERRPALMCSDYPHGKPCEHGALCAWDAAREGYHKGARLKGLRSIASGDLAREAARRRLPLVECTEGLIARAPC